MVRIKFCGITNIKDALEAAGLGINALGFVFAKSPRQVSPEKAKEIIEKLPPWISAVGVFVNEKSEAVSEIAEHCRLDYIQLHGEESPEYCGSLGLKVIKTIKDDIEKISDYNVSGFLLDTHDHGKAGGTGKTFNWDLALDAKKYGCPIILAGGLTPENIGEAVEKVKPYGVDVSSGIELAPGKKDYEKMKRFVEEVKKTIEGK